MASWEYDPVSVPVVQGGERDADLELQAAEGEVSEEEVSAVPSWAYAPKKTR